MRLRYVTTLVAPLLLSGAVLVPGAAATAAPVTFTVQSFSPNHDGHFEKAYLHFTLAAPMTGVSWHIATYPGATAVTDDVALGDLAAGDHEITWDGMRSTGALAHDGAYALWILGDPGDGQGPHLYRSSHFSLDTTGPALNVAVVSPSVYPFKDGYHDTVTSKVKTSEPGVALTLTLTNSAGHVVRGWQHRSSVVWNGRTTSGHLAKPGRYTFTWTGRDKLFNVHVGRTRSLIVSAKRYVSRTKSVTVTAQGSRFYAAKTPCASLLTPAPGRGWKGSDGLRATYCPDDDPSRAYPEVELFGKVNRPKGLGTWTMQVDIYGGSNNSKGDVKLSPAFGGTGPWLDFMKDVPRSLGWHTVLHQKEDKGYDDAEWVLIAGKAASYDVKSFRVTMRYHALV